MRKPFVITLAAVAAGCGKEPTAPMVVDVPASSTSTPTAATSVGTAPPPRLPPMNPPMPAWDDVKSTHPENATNPPSPVLIVDRASATCYKKWEGGMIAAGPDRVEDCSKGGCGILIRCPEPRADELLKASKTPRPSK